MKAVHSRIARVVCFVVCAIFLLLLDEAQAYGVVNVKYVQDVQAPRVFHPLVKHVYPRRKNMETCKPLFGRVGIFVAIDNNHESKHLYKIAQESLKCYVRSTNYTLFNVNMDTDERTRGLCNQTNAFYKRHCVASYYLQDVDWMLFLDADIGVVNPNHCIEEWIDDRVDMIFYERFFNWELVAGSYLFKNTKQSGKFLMDLANMEFHQFDGFTGYDNGALHILILKAVLPGAVAEIKACDAIYHRAKTLDKYYNYVTCVKLQLGANRIWPGILKIHRRGHGWARDSHLTDNYWSDNDFMIHAWKASELNSAGFDANVFTEIPDPEKCGKGYSGWHWILEKYVPIDFVKKRLSDDEKNSAKGYSEEGKDLPHLVEPDVRDCYPDCDKYT